MSEAEQNRLIDEFVAERNKLIGRVKIPQLGEYPPDLENFYGSLMNEWVTTDLIRHYADALGDRNPLWRSEDYAKKTRWGGIIAPPTFADSIIQPYCFFFWPEKFKEMSSLFKYRPFPYAAMMGNKRELFQVIRHGDRIRVIQTYLGIEEIESKRPKPCREFIETHKRTLINQREETVAVMYWHAPMIMNLPPSEEEKPLSGLGRKKRRLTDEERDAITRGYEEEKRRGADTLFWEDVAVGDELKPLVVGPLSRWDNAAWLTAISGHAVAFAIEWERIKINFDYAYFNPETNAWECGGGPAHLTDNFELKDIYEGGAGIGFYSQLEGLIGRMICDWMGDDGFLKMLDTTCDVYPILGEVFHCKGKVTKKYTERGEHLVDLQVWCENQDGLVLDSGSATVRLLSRKELKV